MSGGHHLSRVAGGHSSCAAVLLCHVVPALLALQAVGAQNPLPRDGWTTDADSFEPGNEPDLAIDGDGAATFWHTEYTAAEPDYPHEITITFDGQTNSVNGLTYTPRSDGNRNGRIGDFEIYLSADGTGFPDTPVATGTWFDTPSAKTVDFDATDAQALRLVALSPAPAGQLWASAGDIQVLSAHLCTACQQPRLLAAAPARLISLCN
jgi:alpha-glucosidase